jgi:hypothetical protein
MIKRIAGWVVLVPLSVALVVFCLANRQLVVVNINPFAPSRALDNPGVGLPLFVVIFAFLLLGVILGGIATWLAQGPHRQRERHWRREYQHLSADYEALRRGPNAPRRDRDLLEVDDLIDRS